MATSSIMRNTSGRGWHASGPSGRDSRVRFARSNQREDDIVLDTGSQRFHRPFHPTHPEAERLAGAAEVSGPVKRGPEDWAARVRGFGVEAPKGSDTWNAAMLLVAAAEIGQNVDRLARRLAAARPFVSKCARRLVDNGVWSNGETIATWLVDAAAGDAFVRDIGVAEGKLLRRMDESGLLEWAAAGRWNKSFEKEDEDAGLSASYSDAAPRLTDTVPLAADLESGESITLPSDVEETPTLNDVEPAAAAQPRSSRPEPRPAPPPRATPEPERKPAPDPSAPSLEEVFSDAVWLR